MKVQMQNERNHDGAGAKGVELRWKRCKTRKITTEEVQNEGNHDERNTVMNIYIYIYIRIFYVEQNVAVAQIIQQKRFLCCVFSDFKTRWRDPKSQNFQANPNLPKLAPQKFSL